MPMVVPRLQHTDAAEQQACAAESSWSGACGQPCSRMTRLVTLLDYF